MPKWEFCLEVERNSGMGSSWTRAFSKLLLSIIVNPATDSVNVLKSIGASILASCPYYNYFEKHWLFMVLAVKSGLSGILSKLSLIRNYQPKFHLRCIPHTLFKIE